MKFGHFDHIQVTFGPPSASGSMRFSVEVLFWGLRSESPPCRDSQGHLRAPPVCFMLILSQWNRQEPFTASHPGVCSLLRGDSQEVLRVCICRFLPADLIHHGQKPTKQRQRLFLPPPLWIHFPLLCWLISLPVTDVFVAQIQMGLISGTMSQPLRAGG